MLIEHDGNAILLLATDAGIVALDPTCPHQHVRSLGHGTIEKDAITCPNHGWRFSLKTGLAICGSGRIRFYPTQVSDNYVIVTLPSDAPPWMRSTT